MVYINNTTWTVQIRCSHLDIYIQIVNLIRRIIMFGYTIVNRRFSDAIEFAAVNVVKGTAIVRFKKSGAE